MRQSDEAAEPREEDGEPQSPEDDQRFLLFGRIADEVKQCVRDGREPDIAAYAAQYPQWADEIRELVGTLGIVNAFNILFSSHNTLILLYFECF